MMWFLMPEWGSEAIFIFLMGNPSFTVIFPKRYNARYQLVKIRITRIIDNMKTVIETPTFIKVSRQIWDEDEIDELINYLSVNAGAGDVIPNTGGFRKLRWGGKHTGKRSGSRVIYYNSSEFTVTLVFAYRKNKQTNTTAKEMKNIKNEVENEH